MVVHAHHDASAEHHKCRFLVYVNQLRAPAPVTPLCCRQVLGSGQLGHMAVDFAVHVVRACMLAEPVLGATDLFATLETLIKLSYSLPAPAGLQLQQLVVEARRAKCAQRLPPQTLQITCVFIDLFSRWRCWLSCCTACPRRQLQQLVVEAQRAKCPALSQGFSLSMLRSLPKCLQATTHQG